MSRPIINRTVWVLSLVSLFADVASEMLYPVVPLYLKEIGFSLFLIGVLEGLAEFTAGLSKGYFGKRSDELGLRLPFVKWGYFLSALSKPLMAVFTLPVWIFGVRTLDRLGKGLRTAARDALLSEQATPATKARVFGFHRSMDTLGAVLGPLLALFFLHVLPGQYRALFLWALVPGLVAVALIFLLREVRKPAASVSRGGFFSFFKYWNIAPAEYRKLVAGLLVFTLFNSSDVFLLVKAKAVTGSDTQTILAYVGYNLLYALLSYPLGALADRMGLKRVFVGGLVVFGIVYLLFAQMESHALLFVAFGLYAVYAAATEGIAKAWITNMAGGQDTGTAIGLYSSGQSICSLLASSLTGLLWTLFNSAAAFYLIAFVALAVAVYLALFVRRFR
ncbi:Major Facilitator Superfamily protein [Cnuella takakiae]|uniref:Major Facilitator Superfamily protein n=1 Tax=Cnuella takakiae TaxID=1302690 RepID=A0A1M5D0X0_9BACT|nr:MFS transporter [Cnuella takakiae]OLY94143.1 MFS transporter [Cnuella takakiae]SHF60659.1 Major Facilitator Superfamily protein [Cnuella takakiae]